MDLVDSLVSQLRQPEYTGENRCLPCTVVNTALAVGASVIVGTAGGSFATVPAGVGAGVVALALGVGLVGLRGYLIPWTPALTKRYFPPWLLRAFGKPATDTVRTDGGLDQEELLIEAGALEERPDEPDLRLAPSFREQWYDEIDRVTTEETYDGLFALLAVDDGTVTTDRQDGNLRAKVNGSFVGVWKSEEAFVADIGAATVLAEGYSAWSEFGPHDRHELLSGLRLYIDRCPTCGTTPELGSETVETCCDERTVALVECPACESRLFETRT